MTKVVESGMASTLLNQGWTSLENGLIMNGNIAFMEEGAHLEAISMVHTSPLDLIKCLVELAEQALLLELLYFCSDLKMQGIILHIVEIERNDQMVFVIVPDIMLP